MTGRRHADSHNRCAPGDWHFAAGAVLIFRWLFLLLLLTSAGLFAFYAGTGDVRYRRYGLIVLKWTVGAALFFFAVLIIQRLA